MDEERKKPEPKWLTPEGERSDRVKRSRKNELRIARRLGGKRIVASGARHWGTRDSETAKGDLATPEFHAEHKQTDAASMSLKLAWLQKVAQGARNVAKDPMLVITFEKTADHDQEDYVLLPLEVFERWMRVYGPRSS